MCMMREGTCFALLQCVLLLFASKLHAVSSTSATCFDTPPGTIDRSHVHLKVGRRSWLSHDIASAVTEIVLKEFLGYTVEHATDINLHTGQFWGEEMSSGALDVDVEQWNARVDSAIYQQYVTSEETSVYDVGSIGYSGRAGLFTTQSALEQRDKADFYDFYRASSNSSEFQAQGLFRTFAESQLASFLGDSFPSCNASAFSWCGVGQFAGYWSTPDCRDSPNDCVEVLHTLPSQDTGYFEQLARNHQLALIFGYYGSEMPTHLRTLVGGPKPVVFYWWEPHPLLAEVDAVRISFPDFHYGCDRDNNKNANTGPVQCDYVWLILHKLIASRVRDTAPEAFLFMSNLEILQSEINRLVTLAANPSTFNISEEQINTVACDHIKNNFERFMGFAPACITDPPNPVKDGDFIFNPTTLRCESAVVYHTVPETHCFADSERPGAVDRSDQTLKLVRREWLSHDLSSMVTEVVLREYLGYNVELVYNNRTPDWMFGPEMLDEHYHIDMEQWKAWPGSDNDLEFIRTGQLLNLGPLGFSGRNGMYISSEALNENPTALLDFYKAYTNATEASAAGIMTHAESPLKAVLGDDFPHPCPHVCGTGALEGYWAPPVCLDNPGRCIEIINPAPSWDIAYGEQLINNWGLEAVVGYYGIGPMFDVISSQAGTGRTMPFIWFEPDEFTLKQGAVRISFPDFFYGCDLNNTMNPNSGSISCDWPALDLVKIVSPVVSTRMKDAYMVLDHMKIYTEMMNGLMADEGPYPERVCRFIRSNPAVLSEWAPDCLVRPLSPEQVRSNDTVFFPAELECKPITCPRDQVIRYEPLFASFLCAECGDGEIPDSEQVSCSLCPLGQELDETTRQCRPCLPGTAVASEGYCGNCPPGWFSTGGVAAECEPCSAGFTSVAAASSCVSCPAGTFSGFGANNCTECEAGHFAANMSSTECAVCAIGRYAASPAASQCAQCGESSASPERFVTMVRLNFHAETQYSYVVASDTADHCGCDRGMRYKEGECVDCTEGMQCLGLGDVRILPGYYADADLSVFKCIGDSGRCKGGLPGETCARGRKGVACAECEDNMMVRGDACVPCGEQDFIPFVLFIVIALAVLVLVDVFAADGVGTNKSLAVVFCVIAIGQLVTALQVMSVVSLLSLDWEEPFRTLLSMTTLIALDIEVLRFGCIGTLTPMEKYMSKLVMLLLGLCLLGIIHVVKLAVLRYRGVNVKNKFWSLVAAISALLMLFYIPVASAVLQPLQCKEHPNEVWTVLAYQSVVCWDSSEHTVMLAVSIVGFILVPLGFLAFVIIVLLQLTARIQKVDAKFVRTFAFLFFRFKPGMHWAAVAMMLKNLMLAVCIVIPDPLLQIVFLVIVMLTSWGLVLRLQPWRMLQAQVLDVSLTLVMLMVIVIASFYVDEGDKDFKALSWICFVMVISVLAFALAALVYNLLSRVIRQHKRFQYFLCHHKAGSGAFTRLLQMNLFESAKTIGDVFIDSDHLDNLDHLFDYVRTDTATFVVVVSSDIFTRPWCVGEMTTARIAKVVSVLVVLPGGVLPDETFMHKLTDTGLPNADVLAEAGMDTAMILKTLDWIKSVPKLKMAEKITGEKMSQMVDLLHNKSDKIAKIDSKNRVEHLGSSLSNSCSLPDSSKMPTRESSSPREVYFIYDTDNLDACAACHVLQRMLVPLSDYATELIPDILESARSIPAGIATAMVMCTNGLFENPTCAKIFAKVNVHRHVPYPVLAEPTFRFPPTDVHSWLRQILSGKFQSQEINDASTCIMLLFKEIATQFQPNTASLSVLQVSAREVFRRVISLKKRPTQMSTLASSKHSAVSFLSATDISVLSGNHMSVMTTTLDEEEETPLQGKHASVADDSSGEDACETVSRI